MASATRRLLIVLPFQSTEIDVDKNTNGFIFSIPVSVQGVCSKMTLRKEIMAIKNKFNVNFHHTWQLSLNQALVTLFAKLL